MRPFRTPYALLLASLVSLVLRPPMAAAQIAPSTLSAGRQMVADFMGRMVRVTGRLSGGGGGETGYGFVIGSRPAPGGGMRLLIVTADHLMRDPATPTKAGTDKPANAGPGSARVVFYGNMVLALKAEVLAGHLPADEGDLAVLLTEDPLNARFAPFRMASTRGLLPGSPAWEIGRPGSWELPANPGQYSLSTAGGWLIFDGLDTQRGSAGGPVLTSRGLAGMVVGESAGPTASTRVLPIELLAAKLAEWGIETDLLPPVDAPATTAPAGLAALGFPGNAGDRLTRAMPAPDPRTADPGTTPAHPAALTRQPAAGLVPLLASEAAARSSWVPANARLSPQAEGSAALRSSPRREAARIGSLPPGSILPPPVWFAGAYELAGKLDGGAWFLIASEGEPLGYVSGNDVIELWPAPAQPASGRVVRDWVVEGGRRAVLRDAGTHYDLTIAIACPQAYCTTAAAYTPQAPNAGAIIPAFQVPAITGAWQEHEIANLHLLLPRRVIETAGTKLVACMGQGLDCQEQVLLGG